MSVSNTEASNDHVTLNTQIAELIPAQGPVPEMRSRYIGQLDRIGHTASLEGVNAIQDLCLVLQTLLCELEEAKREITDEESALLLEWPALLMGYLETPRDSLIRRTIIELLQNPIWISPLEQDYAEVLEQTLSPEQTEITAIDNDHKNDTHAVSETSHITPGNIQDFADTTLSNVDAASKTSYSEFNNPLSPDQQELIDLLNSELTEMLENNEVRPVCLTPELAAPEIRRTALQTCAEQVKRIGSAAEMVGLLGLRQASQQIHRNLQILSEADDASFGAETQATLENWPVYMLAYLQNIHDGASCEGLVRCLQTPDWPKPLKSGEATTLLKLLAEATVVAEDETCTPRQTEAHPEDVSLEIPQDVNKELLDGLLQELPSHTAGFSQAIHRAIEGEFLSDIDVAQRIAHTLKGAGNVVGVRGITNLTHHLEDILESLSKHHTLPSKALAETLVNAADCLEAMSDALLGIDSAPRDALEVFQDILDWINRIEREGVPRQGAEGDRARDFERRETQKSQKEPDPDAKQPRHKAGANDTTTDAVLRIPPELAEELLRLAGESMISNAQIQEKLKRSIEQADSIRRQNLLLQQLGLELEQLVDMRSFWSPQRIHDTNGEFDSLELNQYNELHTFTHRLIEAITDSMELTQPLVAQLVDLKDIAIEQGRLNSGNQEAVMRTRMVPVHTVEARLQRSLRQACRMTGKRAQLSVIGAETMVDTNVLSTLMSPLMHLLRNAVDHGIESSELRLQRGKPEQGLVELDFSRRGDHILVRCRDDGSGLDYETIKHEAEERGLLSPDKTPNKQELNQLLLTSGFSTRNNVTQISGRGIGMDAVHDCINGMKGSLGIQSEPSHGTTVELSIPVTLLATHAVFIRTGKQVVAIANRGVDELLSPDVGSLQHMGSRQTYQLGDSIYECVSLDGLLNVATERRGASRNPQSVMLVNSDAGSKQAVLVEEILDTRDVVVKPLGRYAPKPQGVIGATILGDGEVAPVLDLTELLGMSRSATLPARSESKVKHAQHDLPLALVVDDSLSARRSLAQFVQDIGYEVRTAKDGMEAVAIIEHQTPDIMLIDLEMPRMNGLELTAHVRTNKTTHDVPVIMITSRSTEKHRQQASKVGVNVYMTKPFAEDELASTIDNCLEQA